MRRIILKAGSGKWHIFMQVNMLAVVLTAMLTLSLHQAPLARAAAAAGSEPVIHWNSNMIYPGQNNGYPFGPVGENAGVSGANFPANVQLHLVLVQGDSNNDRSLCKSPVAIVGTVTTNGSGAFQQNFTWSAAAGQVGSQYSICGLAAVGGAIISHLDDGPFTVLSSSPPSLSVSPNSVSPQSSVTFSGQNWLPLQAVSISVSNNAFNPIVVNSSGNDGTFSVTFTFPSSVQPGTYTFTGNTANGLLTSNKTNVTIIPPPTPTPTATASATATATDTPTATDTATATDTSTPTSTTNNSATNSSNDSGNTSGGGGGQVLLVGLIVAVALILLAGAGLVIYMIMQRRNAASGNSGPPDSHDQPMPPGGSYSSFGPPMQGPINSYDQATQQGVAYPGFGPPMQPAGQLDNYGQPLQPMQQGSATSGFGSMPANSFHTTGTIASACMNCGMPLAPNTISCPRCGMPVAAPNPNAPNWGR